jgi:hypothetical protein
MQLRPPSSEPVAAQSAGLPARPAKVSFAHPGYADHSVRSGTLLSLPALDDGGIDYDTALVGCGIVAGNRWDDGFFSLERGAPNAAPPKVDRPADGILRDPRYYFHLPGPMAEDGPWPYPVVGRFLDWRFPNGELPDAWEAMRSTEHFSPPTAASFPVDRTACVLSQYGDSLQAAHLVPSAETDWFFANGMQQFSDMTTTYSVSPINSLANVVPMRADLHGVFDERHFCFVPKLVNVNEAKLVTHVFNSTPSGQLPALWHNRCLHTLPSGVALECVFARFAWTVLSPHNFGMFLPSAPSSRRVLLWNAERAAWDVENVEPDRCRTIWNGQRSRSPKKRSAPPGDIRELSGRVWVGVDDNTRRENPWDSGYFGTVASSTAVSEAGEDEERRGRTLKRKACQMEERCDAVDANAQFPGVVKNRGDNRNRDNS